MQFKQDNAHAAKFKCAMITTIKLVNAKLDARI